MVTPPTGQATSGGPRGTNLGGQASAHVVSWAHPVAHDPARTLLPSCVVSSRQLAAMQ